MSKPNISKQAVSTCSKEAIESFLKHRHKYEEGREVTEEENVCFQMFISSRIKYEAEKMYIDQSEDYITSKIHESGSFKIIFDKYQFIKRIDFLTEGYENISIRRVLQKEYTDVFVIVRVTDSKEQFLKFGSRRGIKPCWDVEMLTYGTNYYQDYWMGPSEDFIAENADFFNDQKDAVSFLNVMMNESTVWSDIIIEMKQLYCTITQQKEFGALEVDFPTLDVINNSVNK